VNRVGIILLFVGGACGAPPASTTDGGAGGDGGNGSGLSLAFAIDPAVPGTLLPGVTIDRVDLAIKDLRLTGDAASATDDRTRAGYLAISWRSDHQPYPATFPKAPPGQYSKIAFVLENDTGQSFVIQGTVTVGGTSHNYVIQDDHDVNVSVPMNVMLPVGGTASDTLQAHMLGVLTNVNWSDAVLEPDGTLQLTSDTDLSTVRNNLGAAFTAASIDATH
jgi:hypothetical protein